MKRTCIKKNRSIESIYHYRVQLVMDIFDYTDHVGSAEQWMNQHGFSFDNLDDTLAKELSKKLRKGEYRSS